MMIVTQQRLVSGSVSAHVKSQYVFVTLVPVTILGGCDTPNRENLQGNGILSQGMNFRELLRIQHIDVVMEHVKHQVKLQKFNFGKQKSTTSAVPLLSGGLLELLSQSQNNNSE